MAKSESDCPDTDEVAEGWNLIPENVMIKILKHLSAKEILNCSGCCKRWNFIANDSILWKYKFQQDFKVDKSIKRKPGEPLKISNYITPNVGSILCCITNFVKIANKDSKAMMTNKHRNKKIPRGASHHMCCVACDYGHHLVFVYKQKYVKWSYRCRFRQLV